MQMKLFRIVSAIVFLASIALPVAAQQHHNNERGLDSGPLYQTDGLDVVNLFNGNLTVNIPLGPTYRAGGEVSYSFTLSFNSTLWDFDSQFWSPDQTYYITADPIPANKYNAGFGWNLNLGRIEAPYPVPSYDTYYPIYIAPDGSEHTFYHSLHKGDIRVTNVWYTTDGSYLRMKVVSGKREIEFPDGTVHRFAGAGWKLDQIRDRFGNYLNVTDHGTYWLLVDNTGRTHRVNFRTSAPGLGQVDSLVLAGFNGTTSTWYFTYTDTAMPRHPRDHYPGNSSTVTLPLLTQVVLPDASAYRISQYTSGVAGGWSGLLRRLTLPTLGSLEWTWTRWEFNLDPGYTQEFDLISENDGVATKKILAPFGAQVGQPWTYTQKVNHNDPVSEISEQTTTVTSPEGNDTVYYFNVWPADWDYGLPYTRRFRDSTNTRFLSHEVYQGSTATGTKKRSLYVRYAGDGPTGNTYQFGTKRDFNRRLASQRTVFHNDGGRYADEDFSEFDGLGHFRWSTTGGNFNSGNVRKSGTHFNPSRGVYDYDHEAGAFTASHTFTGSPGVNEAWIFDTYAWKRTVEGSNTRQVTACFDSNGQLVRERRLRLTGASGVNESSTDVLTVYTYTGGNLTREQWYGGDTQTLTANGTTCTMALPSSQYRIDHTWAYGTLASSQYKTASGTATGTLAFKTADRDIDLNTGLVKVSRDSAGAATTYEYDALGRLTWSMPASGGTAWVESVYVAPNALAGTPPSLLTRERANGSKSGTVLDQSEVGVDFLGRTIRERELMPDGSWATRETTYNNSGWVTSVSQLQSGTPTQKTTYSGFDPFGRPGTITPPQGAAQAVTLSYAGVRSATRTVKIGTSRDTSGNILLATASTTEIYDRQGRLWRVTEPSGAGGANVTTEYGWLGSGELGSVKTTAAEGTQYRYFTYDHRGFLLSESLPEGTLTYSNYDSRGHVGRFRDGVNDLTYAYDPAERVTLVRETVGSQRPWKTFTYGMGLTAADRSAGKVKSVTRHNYPVLGGVEHTTPVTYTYIYGGRDGAVSQRDLTMTFNGSPSTSFTQTFNWHHLGTISSLGYPQCTFSPCNGTANSIRTVTFTYTQGLLTAVPGYASAITYHPNGLVNRITHANSVIETWAADGNAHRRPNSISTSGADVNWSSGPYSYDGAGNVVKMGTSWFLYDKVGRLVTGTVFDGPTGGGSQKQQTYTFDSFGNLKSIGGSPGRSLPVNPLTNRLSGTGTVYDAAGELTAWNGATYDYDAFGRMKRMVNGTEEWLYMYDPDERRVWQFRSGAPRFDRWTLYDLEGRMLRTWEATGYIWGPPTDHVHRGGAVLATVLPSGAQRQLHLDHLGTPRLITDATAKKVAYHAYLPFGEEVTGINQDAERMKYTGHQRDLANATSPADDLDYMQMRMYNPLAARFTTMDPAGDHDPRIPQSWNRYAYVRGNPVLHVDPDGQVVDTILDVGFIIYDVYDIGKTLWQGQGITKTQFLALGADVAGVFIPFGTGGGAAVRLAAKVDNPRIVTLAKRLDNIFENHVNREHAVAAAREKLGEVVARKADGTPFDHGREFTEARQGALKAIEELKRLSADPRLSNAEREAAQQLLSAASRKLDEMEALHQRIIDEFIHRRDTRYTVLE